MGIERPPSALPPESPSKGTSPEGKAEERDYTVSLSEHEWGVVNGIALRAIEDKAFEARQQADAVPGFQKFERPGSTGESRQHAERRRDELSEEALALNHTLRRLQEQNIPVVSKKEEYRAALKRYPNELPESWGVVSHPDESPFEYQPDQSQGVADKISLQLSQEPKDVDQPRETTVRATSEDWTRLRRVLEEARPKSSGIESDVKLYGFASVYAERAELYDRNLADPSKPEKPAWTQEQRAEFVNGALDKILQRLPRD
jgi:hypothetical protein